MRRMTAAIDELRTRLANLGYVDAATPILASALECLAQSAVPAHITTGLAKIGLAGASSTPAVFSVLSASLVLKLSLAAVTIAIVATGAWFLLLAKPPIMPVLAVPAIIPATVPAAAADWRTTFDNAYALLPNQNLKFIPPGRFPERLKYFTEVENNDTPMPCIQWSWANGALKRHGMAGSGPAGASLSTILQFCANFDQHHAPTAGLPAINCDGDWIVRGGAPTTAILADLHTILLGQFNADIRFEKTEVTKDALVAIGQYHFKPLAGATDRDLQIFADVLDHPRPGDSCMGGGTTVPAEFWTTLGDYFAIPFVDETRGEPAQIGWSLSRSIANADKEPARGQKILDNITRQTGVIFKRERRVFITWKLTSDRTPPATGNSHDVTPIL